MIGLLISLSNLGKFGRIGYTKFDEKPRLVAGGMMPPMFLYILHANEVHLCYHLLECEGHRNATINLTLYLCLIHL